MAVDTDKLQGLMAENHISGAQLAGAMKMSSNTFYRKMKKKKFSSDEMKIIAETVPVPQDLLVPVFFADLVT